MYSRHSSLERATSVLDSIRAGADGAGALELSPNLGRTWPVPLQNTQYFRPLQMRQSLPSTLAAPLQFVQMAEPPQS